jgi:phosphoribosylanthranilate isomerase
MTKVKICGLRRPEDAELAVELGAWALGMIMWPASPRYCEPQRAADLADAHRRSAEIAGVFVDQKIEDVVNLTNEIGLSIVQLHGSEGQQYCELIAQRTGARVIKAFRVKDRSIQAELGKFWDVDFHLLDSYKAGVPGGTGEAFDWRIISTRQTLTSRGEQVPAILSGGLTPENVAEAIRVVHPFAVDVASGVEIEPGVKDPVKMQAFFEAVRSVPVEEPEAEPLTGVNEEVLTLRFAREEAAAKKAEEERAIKFAAKKAFIEERRAEEKAEAEAAAAAGEVGETGEDAPAEDPEAAEISEGDVEEVTETEADAVETDAEAPVESTQ